MPRIYVEFNQMKQLSSDCQKISSRVGAIQSDFQRIVRQLDWNVRYQSNINSTANILGRKLQGYTRSLNGYQYFLDETYIKYRNLDADKQEDFIRMDLELAEFTKPTKFIQPTLNISIWDAFKKRYGYKDVIKGFGNVGKVFGTIDGIRHATTWNQWSNIILSGGKTISKIGKDIKNYTKIGKAIGTKNAVAYFLKKQVVLRNVGHASTASNPFSRFYNNLHNTTSSFTLKDAFAPLTGKKGAGTTVAAWAGVALTGVSNLFSNFDEQKKSNGKMSNARVAAETISETAIDTVVTYGGAAVVGAAITAATGVVAAPVVVAAATGVAVAGINAGVEALTGKSATEWVSDAILDTGINVGKAIGKASKATANWFKNLSFA